MSEVRKDIVTSFNLLNYIVANIDDLHSEQFMPMNYYFKLMCQLNEKLLNKTYINLKERDED